MEVTKNVILDLLPLYLAGEVSSDTRKLVEAYLEDHPDVARLAERSKAMEMEQDVPVPLRQEDKMDAYKAAKVALAKRMMSIAAIIAVVLLSLGGIALWMIFFFMSK